MRAVLRVLACWAALLPLLLVAAAQDAVPTIVIPVAPGASRLLLGLPEPAGSAAAEAEFAEVLRRDLELSGWFDIVDRAASLEPPGAGVRPGEFRFEDWDPSGASVLARTRLEEQGDKLRAEVWVYDVSGRRRLGARAFTTRADAARLLAHRVADEVVYRVTGRHGPFDTRFAFAGTFTGNKEIYVVDFDGHGRTQVTRNGSINLDPAWSPDGARIAFVSYMGGNPDLYVADLAAGRITRLSARRGLNTSPAFHPGGRLLALTLAPAGDPEIFTVDARTGAKVARLTRSLGIDTSPAWSPDGRRVAFVSDRSGGAQIYVMNADGTGARRVTFQGSYNTSPAWSPDGSRIAFVGRDEHFDVFTVRPDGTDLRRITQDAGDNEDPTWSPDGAYIAYSSTRTGAPHIWMATADGSHEVQLTTGPGGYTAPAWSPSLGW